MAKRIKSRLLKEMKLFFDSKGTIICNEEGLKLKKERIKPLKI